MTDLEGDAAGPLEGGQPWEIDEDDLYETGVCVDEVTKCSLLPSLGSPLASPCIRICFSSGVEIRTGRSVRLTFFCLHPRHQTWVV